MHRSWWWIVVGAVGALGCSKAESAPASQPTALAPADPAAADADAPYDACRARVAKARAEAALPGAPDFDRRRAEILGRARGEPMVFVRAPARSAESALPDAAAKVAAALARDKSPFTRVTRAKRLLAGDKAALRALLLSQGYLYSDDPIEALALTTRLTLTDLFDEERVLLQRGSRTFELVRKNGRPDRYVHDDGSTAELLFGDRVAPTRDALTEPLHRDLRRLAQDVGFERAEIAHRTPNALVARLRFGGEWASALLENDGAALRLACLAEPKARRARFEDHIARDEPRRAALRRLRATVSAQLSEALPFDRPRGEETAERDGQLRPAWRFAYTRGYTAFVFEEETYPVFDPQGRPHPPQVCVDFVLDSYERAAGTWYVGARPRPDERGRVTGLLDFDAHGITNRRGVLAFEKFASERSDLFEHARFEPHERIQFRERTRFFDFLVVGADRFRPGDVVAIQGRKNDGLIHQHAILIEDTDPLTGFPDALADQMKRPRRRTWEGIMAEAPLRSLLYRVRPKPALLELASGRK